MNFKFQKQKHRFSIVPGVQETAVMIEGMHVGCITRCPDSGIFRINLSVTDPKKKVPWKWAPLKQPFHTISEVKNFLTNNIDDILRRFELHPIVMP